MELGGGWYDDSGIMENISKLVSSFEKIGKKEHKSVAEIIIVVDEKSVMCAHPSIIRSMDELINNIMLCGAPVDIVYSFDIDNIDFSTVKVVFNVTANCLDAEYVSKLKNKVSKNAFLIFVGNSSYTCGFDLIDTGNSRFPEFYIRNCESAVLKFGYGSDKVFCALNDENEFLLSDYRIDSGVIRLILQACNVTFYSPQKCTVYADNRIVSFFAAESISFVPPVLQDGMYKNLMTSEKYIVGNNIKIDSRSGIAFIKE